MIYFAKMKDGRAVAFNTPEEMEAFERSWRGLPSAKRPIPDPLLFGRVQAMALASEEKAIAQGARFDDYVTVFTLPDEALTPLKPKRQPAKRRAAALAIG